MQAAGPELAFARALLRTGISTKIGFIPAAIGGHGMFTDYCPTCWFYQEMVKNTKAAIAAFGGRAVLRGVLFVQVGLCSATGVGPWAQPHVDYYYCSSLSWAAGYWIKQYVSASAVPPLTGGGRGNVCGVVRPLSGLGSALGRGVHQVCPQDTRGPAGGGRRAAAAHHHGCDAGVVPGQGQGQGGISV